MSKVLDKEIQTFEENREMFEEEHDGEFVLIKGDDIIGFFPDFQKAADEGIKEFGREPFLIRHIGEPPPSIPVAILLGLASA